MQPKFSLTEGSISARPAQLFTSILFGNVLQSINGSVNAIWVGKYLGEASLAAAGNSNVVMFLLFGAVRRHVRIFHGGNSDGRAVRGGEEHRRGEARRGHERPGFFLGLSLSMSLLGFALAHMLLNWLHTPPDVVSAGSCLHAHHFSGAALHGRIVLPSWAVLRGAGDSKTPFKYLVMSVALDVALNPLLIFGWGPIPRLGIAGSAGATLIAQAVSFFALVAHLYRTKHFLCIHRNDCICSSPIGNWRGCSYPGHPHGTADVRGVVQHDCADFPGEPLRLAGNRGVQRRDAVGSRRDAVVELRADAGAGHRPRGVFDGCAERRRGGNGIG